ncbi:hypothetical protein, partial [Burkholderia cenocepacia]|uniref:hypothetical protein n=1 Tax=Burkholderia cenocepacia TaxID=95486 RepID=UPI002AAF7802
LKGLSSGKALFLFAPPPSFAPSSARLGQSAGNVARAFAGPNENGGHRPPSVDQRIHPRGCASASVILPLALDTHPAVMARMRTVVGRAL